MYSHMFLVLQLLYFTMRSSLNIIGVFIFVVSNKFRDNIANLAKELKNVNKRPFDINKKYFKKIFKAFIETQRIVVEKKA